MKGEKKKLNEVIMSLTKGQKDMAECFMKSEKVNIFVALHVFGIIEHKSILTSL